MALIHYVCNLKDARGNLLPLEQRSLGDVYKILAYKSVNEINRILAELPPDHLGRLCQSSACAAHC